METSKTQRYPLSKSAPTSSNTCKNRAEQSKVDELHLQSQPEATIGSQQPTKSSTTPADAVVTNLMKKKEAVRADKRGIVGPPPAQKKQKDAAETSAVTNTKKSNQTVKSPGSPSISKTTSTLPPFSDASVRSTQKTGYISLALLPTQGTGCSSHKLSHAYSRYRGLPRSTKVRQKEMKPTESSKSVGFVVKDLDCDSRRETSTVPTKPNLRHVNAASSAKTLLRKHRKVDGPTTKIETNDVETSGSPTVTRKTHSLAMAFADKKKSRKEAKSRREAIVDNVLPTSYSSCDDHDSTISSLTCGEYSSDGSPLPNSGNIIQCVEPKHQLQPATDDESSPGLVDKLHTRNEILETINSQLEEERQRLQRQLELLLDHPAIALTSEASHTDERNLEPSTGNHQTHKEIQNTLTLETSTTVTDESTSVDVEPNTKVDKKEELESAIEQIMVEDANDVSGESLSNKDVVIKVDLNNHQGSHIQSDDPMAVIEERVLPVEVEEPGSTQDAESLPPLSAVVPTLMPLPVEQQQPQKQKEQIVSESPTISRNPSKLAQRFRRANNGQQRFRKELVQEQQEQRCE